jgi:hypothetical protein
MSARTEVEKKVGRGGIEGHLCVKQEKLDVTLYSFYVYIYHSLYMCSV